LVLLMWCSLMSNPVNELLDESDRIKELSDDAVKDIFVRTMLYKRNKRGFKIGTDAHKEFVSELKASDESSNLYEAVRRVIDIQVQSKMNKSDKRPEDFLWGRLTNSDLEEDIKIALAREKLNKLVSGGCGMPIHEVIRDNMEAWKGL